MSDLRLWKVVLEVRFPHAATLFDNRGKIAAKWRGQFDLTDWRISQNHVTLYNKRNDIALNVGLQNIAIILEMPKSFETFQKLAIDFCVWTLDTLNVIAINRIGLRMIQIARRKNFKNLVNKTKQLYTLNDNDWQLFEGQIEDVGFPLTLNFGDKKANFNFGPMQSTQLANYFESRAIIHELPSVSILIDIDIYQNDPDTPAEKYHDFIDNYIRTCQDQIIGITNKFLGRFGGFR
jgi:hypothetical protein